MTVRDEFRYDRVPCRPRNMDRYHVRRSILFALRQSMGRFHGELLDLGCGEQPYRELILEEASSVVSYAGMDIESPHYTREPDLRWDGLRIPLPDASKDTVLLTEVLEHCPDPQAVLSEIRRVLRPGGWLFLTVPFVWPLHDVPYDEGRPSPYALSRYLEQAGFARDKIALWPLGGSDAALATVIGLWVNRRPMPAFLRRFLGVLLYPLVRILLRLNGSRKVRFEEGELITGIAGLAQA
jgi:SAM-dependent methyltransferase